MSTQDLEPFYRNSPVKANALEIIDELRACVDERRYPKLLARLAHYCPGFADQCELLKLFGDFRFPAVGDQARSVAQFYYRASNGGIERVLTELASMFDAAGKRSLVITNIPHDETCYETSDGVRWATVAEFHMGNAREQTVERHLEELLALLRENDVDVLVHHAWLSMQCGWDLLLCRLLGVRFVFVAHGVFSHPLMALPPEERACFALIPRIVALSDAVVSLSEANRVYYRQFNSNSFAIPNPVPSNMKAGCAGEAVGIGRSGNPPDKGPTVLWVGRFDDQKRPLDAVLIMKDVIKAIPNARLVFVGKSENGQYEHAIEAEAKSAGIASSVELKGFAKDVRSCYENADALLFTTEIEGYGLVLVEAAAAGLPVVMYDLPYLATAGCTDWISKAPLYDIGTAARKLTEVLEDAETRCRMSKAARRYFEELSNYDLPEAWEAAMTCPAREMNAFETGAIEGTVWNAVFEHCLLGCATLDKMLDGMLDGNKRAIAAALAQQRHEFETSNSWRIGRAITALPRKLRGRA